MYTDPSGHSITAVLTAMLVGAVINVGLSWLGATITGQEYTWQDACAHAVVGAVSMISKSWAAVGALANGIYTGIVNYENGATLEGAILSGASSAVLTYFTIGNLAQLGTSASDIFSTVIFGSGYIFLSSAISKAVTQNSESSTNYEVSTPIPKQSIVPIMR